MKRLVLLSLVLVIGVLNVYGQRDGAGEDQQLGKKGKIEGKVFVKGDGPMEYANVALYREKDSSLVTGTVTDTDGTFVLKKVSFGQYYLEVDFIGFKKKRLSDLEVSRGKRKQDMGKIYLRETSQEIEGVEVTANRPQVTYKVDKKVINVDEDYTAQGGSAVQVLENVPSIQVDIEGNVELRGSSNFRVLVDGKPSVLDGSDALQQIPASMIDDIEIITNPSAKYDPEGTAGIINVITKKGKRSGLNGMLKASAGTNESYDGNANLNYRLNDKLNLTTSINYRKFNFDMDGMHDRTNYLEDTTSYIDQTMSNTMERDGYSFEGGIEYSVTNNSSLSLSGSLGNFGFGRGGSKKIKTYTRPASYREYQITSNSFDINNHYYNVNLDYQNKFNGKDHKLDASVYYSGSSDEDVSSRKDIQTDSEWDKNGDDPYRQRTEESGNEDQVRVKLDYTLPFSGEGKLETGYQGRYQESVQDYILQNYHNGQWVTNQDFTNDATYTRTIQALYATYSGKLIGLEYKLGLRGEYTDRLLKQQTLNEKYPIDRFNIFPSVHLTKRFSRKEQLFASYSKRIRRPRSWYIDPFRSYMDQYNVRKGNPALEPEYTDSYELGYKKTFGKSFASAEAYYRQTNNEITRIQEPGAGNMMIHTFQNISREYSMGVELMLNTSLYKWWNLNISGNYYRHSIDGEVIGQSVSRNSNNWSARFNNTFKLPTDTRIQLMGRYRGPSVTAQGERDGFFMTNVAVKQSFMDNKLSLTVSGRDLLQSMNMEMTSSGPGFEAYRYFERESPIVNFSVTYTINNYERKRERGERSQGQEYEGRQQMF
jgi:outer membrane receptor protein involved in Fe transport